MAKTAVSVAAVVALLCLGGGFLWAAYQLGRLLERTRLDLLPQLTEAVRGLQANMVQLEALTRSADDTVQGAHEVVAVAQKGARAAEHAAEEVGRVVVREGGLRLLSVAAGVAAGWRVLRARPMPGVTGDPGAVPDGVKEARPIAAASDG
ncbi:MAG: hypothetical protein VKQ33_15335 [Candidatus Sericytochromatia bacterium]|nr:hypothetical protein [Candidatus Sericytochromatia bacterium]